MSISIRKKVTFSITKNYQKLNPKINEGDTLALIFDEEGNEKIIKFTSPYHCQILNLTDFSVEKNIMVQDLNYSMAQQSLSFMILHKGTLDEFVKKNNDSFIFNMRKKYNKCITSKFKKLKIKQ